jgi:hypothetical protein
MSIKAFVEDFEQPLTMVADPLPVGPEDRLKQLESVIEAVERSWEPLARALVEIRDSKLYRDFYDSFEKYVEQRWELSRARAYQLMEAVKVKDFLSTTGRHLPTSERQARALMGLEPDLQLKVWLEAIKDDPNPSGQKVADARRTLINAESKKLRPATVRTAQGHIGTSTRIAKESNVSTQDEVEIDPPVPPQWAKSGKPSEINFRGILSPELLAAGFDKGSARNNCIKYLSYWGELCSSILRGTNRDEY